MYCVRTVKIYRIDVIHYITVTIFTVSSEKNIKTLKGKFAEKKFTGVSDLKCDTFQYAQFSVIGNSYTDAILSPPLLSLPGDQANGW